MNMIVHVLYNVITFPILRRINLRYINISSSLSRKYQVAENATTVLFPALLMWIASKWLILIFVCIVLAFHYEDDYDFVSVFTVVLPVMLLKAECFRMLLRDWLRLIECCNESISIVLTIIFMFVTVFIVLVPLELLRADCFRWAFTCEQNNPFTRELPGPNSIPATSAATMGLLLAAAAAAVIYLVYYIFDFYRWVAKYPRGPTPLPFVGNLLSFDSKSLHLHFNSLSREFGLVFTVFIPVPMVVITGHEAIKEAFVIKGDSFAHRPNYPFDDQMAFCENGGVISSNGDSWRENRRQAISILRDFGMGKGLMEEKVKLSILEYLRYLDQIKDKGAVDMRWPVQLMVANIINETLFGYRYEYDKCKPLIDYVEAFNKFISDLSQSFLRFFSFKFPWIKYIPVLRYHAVIKHRETKQRLMKYITANVRESMGKYKADEEPDCFVHAYAQKIGSNPYLTKEQLLATCDDFFLAALVHEIQRRANILSINVLRETQEETEVMGYRIPARTLINGDLYRVHANDPLFDNPSEFRPERYLNEDGKTINKDAVDRTIPFSLGKRQCAGEGLARVELLLGLSSTVQKYRILPTKEGPVDLTPYNNIVILPKQQPLRLEKL
ncbi:hypothetical protein PRIPAC_92839 [Pristionchus pacificus]|uniref:Cytochrome P450 n=1 Tax=Pristionchus pacificus TaxID=54126 RepID=A0A2A6BRE1_PRIPA|nr:hypothetical protein PRIPAC_92839 [Pristionchus pacificus]|eukprot:PDM68321.1 cytochrome P450 [Pristionchus pacificus]